MQRRFSRLKSIFMVTLFVLSTTLAGCLDGVTDQEDESTAGNSAGSSVPKQAMGLWPPNVDGHLSEGNGFLFDEWSDSYKITIQLEGVKGTMKKADLMIKAVDQDISIAISSNEFSVSPSTIKIDFNDRKLVSQVQGNPAIFYKSSPDCKFFDCDEEGDLPIVKNMWNMSIMETMTPIFPTNSIASTYNFLTSNLVTEATAHRFFYNSSQADIGIEIHSDGGVWSYQKSFNFDWVIPLIYTVNDISIERIEVTQTIQTENNDVRLVEGKDTLVRVFVDSGDLESIDVKVTLQFCILVFCVKSIEKTHTAVQNPSRYSYSDSANFLLPSDWVTYPGLDEPLAIGLNAKVEYLSDDEVSYYIDTNPSNDNLFHVAWFNATHDLNIHYVPMTVGGYNVIDYYTDSGFAKMDAILPTNANLVEIDTRFFTTREGYDATDFTMQGVELLNILMIYSELTGNIPYPDQLVLLHPWQVDLLTEDGDGLCGISSPEWGSIEPDIHSYITISKVSDFCLSKGVIAHEINHNLGPMGGTFLHTWVNCVDGAVDVNGNGYYDPGIDECDEEETDSTTIEWGVGDGTWAGHIGPECNATEDDPGWTEIYGSDRTIEDLGWTSFFQNSETNEDSLISDVTRELMGYCNTEDENPEFYRWMSIYRWNHLYDLFEDWEVGNPTGRNSEEKSRIVSVSLNENNSGKLAYTYTMNSSPLFKLDSSRENSRERFEIRTFSEANQLLEVKALAKNANASHESHEGIGGDHNTIVILQEKEPASEVHLVYIDENGNETLLDAFYDDSKKPEVTINSIPSVIESRGEEIKISWDTTQQEGMADVLYQLEYSFGYDLWFPIGLPTSNKSLELDFGTLPGSPNSTFRIKAMNGMSTSYVTTNSFTLPYQDPKSNLSISENLHDGKINYGEAFDFEVTYTDPDWAAPNLNSCKVTLKRGKEIIWGEGAQTINRLVTKNLDFGIPKTQGGCNILGDSKIGVSFPNDKVLLSELIPGEYRLDVEYVDEHGGIARDKFEFIIEVDFSQTAEYREKALELYRNNLVSLGDNELRLTPDELRYVVTLAIVNSGDVEVKDFSATKVAELMMISESRRKELDVISNDYPIKTLEKSNAD